MKILFLGLLICCSGCSILGQAFKPPEIVDAELNQVIKELETMKNAISKAKQGDSASLIELQESKVNSLTAKLDELQGGSWTRTGLDLLLGVLGVLYGWDKKQAIGNIAKTITSKIKIKKE